MGLHACVPACARERAVPCAGMHPCPRLHCSKGAPGNHQRALPLRPGRAYGTPPPEAGQAPPPAKGQPTRDLQAGTPIGRITIITIVILHAAASALAARRCLPALPLPACLPACPPLSRALRLPACLQFYTTASFPMDQLQVGPMIGGRGVPCRAVPCRAVPCCVSSMSQTQKASGLRPCVCPLCTDAPRSSTSAAPARCVARACGAGLVMGGHGAEPVDCCSPALPPARRWCLCLRRSPRRRCASRPAASWWVAASNFGF